MFSIKTSAPLPSLRALALVVGAALSVIGAGCGDSNDYLPDCSSESQALAVVDGVTGCYRTCESDENCGGGTRCDSGICVTGQPEAPDREPDSPEPDGTTDPDVPRDPSAPPPEQCAGGEVLFSLDIDADRQPDELICISRCESPEDCGGEERCDFGHGVGLCMPPDLPLEPSQCTLQITAGEEACEQCLAQSCCVQSNRCLWDQGGCWDIVMCQTSGEVPDPELCHEPYPEGRDAFDAFLGCMNEACAEECF